MFGRPELIEHLERDVIPETPTMWPPTDRWMNGLEPFGRVVLVRAAVAAARFALPGWERAHPTLTTARTAIEASERWLQCPCTDCANRAAAQAFPYGEGDDLPFPFSDLALPRGERVSYDEMKAHFAADHAALAPSSESAVGPATASVAAAANSMSPPDQPDASERVRKHVREVLLHWAKTAPAPAPGEPAGEWPIARAQATEEHIVRPAFAEVRASKSLADKFMRVSIAKGRPDGRAWSLFTKAYPPPIRVVSEHPAGWAPEDRYLGSTLVIEELETLSRVFHPLAGMILFTMLYDLKGDDLTARSKFAILMRFDKAVHTFEASFPRPRLEDLQASDVLNQVLNALTFYTAHAMDAQRHW